MFSETTGQRVDIMQDLSGNLVLFLCEFLELKDVLLGLGRTSLFLFQLLHQSASIARLADLHLGNCSLPASCLLRSLFTVAFRSESLLSFQGVHTTGGVYQSRRRYQLQNMFEYSGSAYTTHDTTANVLTAALLSDKPAPPFFQGLHEDLDWFNIGLRQPDKYQDMPLLDDILLKKGAKPRKLSDITYKRPSLGLYWQSEREDKEVSFEQNSYKPSSIGVINRVAIGRPALATCPVHSLLIWTNTHIGLEDLSDYFSLSDREAVRTHASLGRSIETEGQGNGCEWVEFKGETGPLLWMKFLEFDMLQFEYVLARRRVVRQLQVLMISSEDRRTDYGTRDAAIDINYVVCCGWSLPFPADSSSSDTAKLREA